MKKILFMLAGILFIFASCSDGGSDSPDTPKPNPQPQPEEQASITLTTDIPTGGLVFDEQGGEKSVEFSTNKDWTLSIAATTGGTSWCTVSKESGSKGDVTVTFTVAENTEYDDRSVSVTIKAGSASKTFKIAQKGIEGLLVTTTTFEVPQEGGTIDVEVKANIEYQLEIAETAKGWITEATSRALTTKNHSFAIAASEESEKREGEIYIKSGDKLETVKVYQAGGALILLSQNEYIVSDAGETITVDVKSNVEYGVQMPDVDWIVDEASTRGMSSHTLQYTILPNETYDTRSTEIIFYDKISDVKDTLTITQAQKDAIILSQKEINVENEGGTIEVKLSANVDFEVTMPEVDWISQVGSRGLVEHSLYFTIAENASEEGRSAEIVFTNTESQLSEKVTINQKGVAYLELVQDEYTVNNDGETIEIGIKNNIEYEIQMPEVDWITKDVSTEVLKFVVAANETYDNRSAEIIFYGMYSDLKDTLTINQTHKDAIVISQKEHEVKAEGDTIEVKLSTNVDFEITMPEVNWINQVTSRGLVEHSLYFTISENVSEEGRSAEIVFTNTESEMSETVTITQLGISFLELIQDEYIVSDAGETIEVEIKSNVEYGIQLPEVDWITKDVSTEVLKFVVAANETYDNRSAEIIFYDKNSDLKDTLTINQAQKDAIALAVTEYSILSEGGTLDVEIDSNVDFTIETSVDWIKQITVSRGLESKLQQFMIDENTAEEAREGVITFIYNDLKQSAKVKQDGKIIPYVTFTADAPQTLTMSKVVNTLEYSVNGGEWTELSTNMVTFGGNNGELRLRGKNDRGTNDATIIFGNETLVACSGDIRTLLDYEKHTRVSTVYARYEKLFYGCASLITAPDLPATNLAKFCYHSMFENCINLLEAPELPDTSLSSSCYNSMFKNCTSLVKAPELPAKEISDKCYYSMFENCINLLEAPELPATSLSSSCYYSMFKNCTNLVKAPELPATTLANRCYACMFENCTSLVKVPELPATFMEEYCYYSMFEGCVNLIESSALPATHLVKGCYNSMFKNCINLLNSPILHAKLLVEDCYNFMFNGCEQIDNIVMLATNIGVEDCLLNWLYNVSPTGTFTKAKEMTSLPEGNSGIPRGWTVVDYEE